jgi:hypothetical protein
MLLPLLLRPLLLLLLADMWRLEQQGLPTVAYCLSCMWQGCWLIGHPRPKQMMD